MISFRDIPDIWFLFRLAGYLAIFYYPVSVPAKMLNRSRYCNRIFYLTNIDVGKFTYLLATKPCYSLQSATTQKVLRKVSSGWHENYINYSLDNQNIILCYRHFDFTSEVFIRTDSDSGRHYVWIWLGQGKGRWSRITHIRQTYKGGDMDQEDRQHESRWRELPNGTNSYILTTATGS